MVRSSNCRNSRTIIERRRTSMEHCMEIDPAPEDCCFCCIAMPHTTPRCFRIILCIEVSADKLYILFVKYCMIMTVHNTSKSTKYPIDHLYEAYCMLIYAQNAHHLLLFILILELQVHILNSA